MGFSVCGHAVTVVLVFAILLHAARRAMAVATIFPPLKPGPVHNYKEPYRGSLISFPPCPPNNGKEKKIQKKMYILFVVCPARSPPLRRGPKLHLASIPYIHRRHIRSLVLARGLGPPRSSWALRFLIALLLFCPPHSMASARWRPHMW